MNPILPSFIEEIARKSVAGRDILVDDLNDLLAAGQVSRDEIQWLLVQMGPVLRSENDPVVAESIFNLIGTAISRAKIPEELLSVIIAMMTRLSDRSLAHAIPIIGSSNANEKSEVIKPFLKSSNAEIRVIAQKTLDMF